MNMTEKTGNKPWWREPWPWILIAGPALAVIGCVITIVLAFNNFADQAVVDGGSKRGLVIERTDAVASGAQASIKEKP